MKAGVCSLGVEIVLSDGIRERVLEAFLRMELLKGALLVKQP